MGCPFPKWQSLFLQIIITETSICNYLERQGHYTTCYVNVQMKSNSDKKAQSKITVLRNLHFSSSLCGQTWLFGLEVWRLPWIARARREWLGLGTLFWGKPAWSSNDLRDKRADCRAALGQQRWLSSHSPRIHPKNIKVAASLQAIQGQTTCQFHHQ